jgi:hypothetical protein
METLTKSECVLLFLVLSLELLNPQKVEQSPAYGAPEWN